MKNSIIFLLIVVLFSSCKNSETPQNEVMAYNSAWWKEGVLYQILQIEHSDIYAFTRSLDTKKLLVLLNFTEHDSSIVLSENKLFTATVINNFDSVINNHGKIISGNYCRIK